MFFSGILQETAKFRQIVSFEIIFTSLKDCKKTLFSQLFGIFQAKQKNEWSHEAVDSYGYLHPLLVHYLICLFLNRLCYLALTPSMDACFRCSGNRVLCNLWRKTTFCYGYTNKSLDFQGKELM